MLKVKSWEIVILTQTGRIKIQIPLIGSSQFVVSGRQISPMPVQKDRISDTFASESIARMCIYADIYPPTKIEKTDVGGFCSTNFYKMGTGPYVCLRPVVGVAQSGLTCVNVSSLAHETSNAHDHVVNPVSEIDPKSDQVNLRSELQAYAVGKVIQDYLTYNDGIMFSYPSLQDRVEEVRRKVNGPLRSEGAFDVNDDLIEQLDRAGLRGIY